MNIKAMKRILALINSAESVKVVKSEITIKYRPVIQYPETVTERFWFTPTGIIERWTFSGWQQIG